VRTKRTGAAAKAGHDLLLHVTDWRAGVDLGEHPSLTLDADGASLRVQEGTGGMQQLGDDDVASIHQSIDDDVLRRQPVSFHSTAAEPDDDGRVRVEGELTVGGASRPVAFDLETHDGRIRGRARIRQSDFGIKQFSILFGALKVADEVEVEIDAAQSR
jgi:hypothetical protein